MVYCSFLPASSASEVGEKESASEVGGGEFRHKWWSAGPRSPLLLVSSPTLSTQPALLVPNRVYQPNNKSFSDNFLNLTSSGSTISETGPKNWAIPTLSTRGALLAPNARTLISIPDTGSPPLLLRSCLSTRDLRRAARLSKESLVLSIKAPGGR